MSEAARSCYQQVERDRTRRRDSSRDRRRRPFATVVAVAVLAALAGLLAAPASALAVKRVTASASASTLPSTVNRSAVVAAAAKHKATWRWTKAFALGHITGLKRRVEYGTYGLACPTTHLCVVPMDGTSVNPPYNSPAGDFYTTDPAKGPKGWKLRKWTKDDYAPGDTLSNDNIACAPAGAHTDCNIAGREPGAGSDTESYGAAVFQTGTPTVGNWGQALVDDSSPGFGAVSCFVNVQCAEIDDNGNIFTTAGATVTSDVSVFPADAGFSGIWWIGCAPYQSGQHNFFCAAVDQNGRGSIAWTVNPGDPDTKWSVGHVKHGTLFNVACWRPGTCIINNNGELIVTSGDTKSKSWVHSFKKVTLPQGVGRTVATIDCNAKLCAAAGQSVKLGQYVAIATNPHGHWSVVPLSTKHKAVLHDGISNISCPTTKLCVVDNGDGQVTVGTK
jgi:hypothetical protein